MTTTPSAPTTQPATAHDAPSGGEFVAVLHAAMRAVRREADAQLGADAVAPGQLRLLRVLDRAGECSARAPSPRRSTSARAR
ncbi:hypothetical protein [Luteimicrobium album]|uniref:hypothetical protein n=1 Tax=Luteimicrobium album TaxID=1054550 RepID=UPI0024E07CE2|nr:hypothetical protein [Luteimicrobium album]